MRIDVAGVMVDAIKKPDVLQRISEFVASGAPHLIVTTYSEFIVFSAKDELYRKTLNGAALSLPDGIGILWAAKYLSLPARSKAQACWQVIYTGASLMLAPSYAKDVIPEQVTGSRLFWDIAGQAASSGYSLALVGGEGQVAALVAARLREKYPTIKINIAESDAPFDERIVQKISASNSDILLVAYQPPKQEKWLAENLEKLNVKVAIGLGGTFDYVAGKRILAPKFVSALGLEWLWRLITQPWRWKRIWNAIAVFITVVYKYKVKQQSI